MPFKLEALDAKHGDALLLHFEKDDGEPGLVLIDGGPGMTFDTLKRRLDQLRPEAHEDDFAHAQPLLDIRLLMVTHIDDDHIGGILQLAEYLFGEVKRGLPYKVHSLWFNSFDVLVGSGTIDEAETAALASAFQDFAPETADLAGEAVADLASVKQGRDLRALAETQELDWRNREFGEDLVSRPEAGTETRDVSGLQLTVLGPPGPNVNRLRKRWAKALAKRAKSKKARAAALAELVAHPTEDSTVENLSSLIVLVEFRGRTILLTGDARTKDILAGLEAHGRLKLDDPASQFPVDVLKVPHHGSPRNARKELFERVPAHHYVISGNGGSGNPNKQTIEWLVEARGSGDYTVHLTNQTDNDGNDLEAFTLLKQKEADGVLKVQVRSPCQASIEVDLIAPGGKG